MDGARVQLGEPIGDAVSRIRFAPGSNNLLISSWDSVRYYYAAVLRLFDVDGCVLRVRAPSDGALLDCCFEDEKAALSASSDGCIRRYDFCSETQTIVGNHDDSVTCIDHSKETGQFISAGLDKKLMFWDLHMKNGHAGCTQVINVYDLRNLRVPVQIKESSMSYQIRCVRSFSSCEGYASGSVDGCVALEYFDPSKSHEMGCVFRCHPKSKSGRCHLVTVNDIGFHPCSDTFVTGDNEGYAIIWDIQSKKRLYELPRYPCSVASLSYNHSGQLLAVSSSCIYQEAREVLRRGSSNIHSRDGEHCKTISSILDGSDVHMLYVFRSSYGEKGLLYVSKCVLFQNRLVCQVCDARTLTLVLLLESLYGPAKQLEAASVVLTGDCSSSFRWLGA
ncbi:WD40 [Musa troglodytarum]|uniref:WD40 n=1 Tax=Musa troglodytarum TaxID=320322 RepID=A0A9E7L406_9LILI|nr:WD40 [Musa troglodytarum]